jgi:predicted nucleic acid-binding protein
MSETEASHSPEYALFDAGVFIGALLKGDPRHAEARHLVEQARRGMVSACTTTGILRAYPKTYSVEQRTSEKPEGKACEAAVS